MKLTNGEVVWRESKRIREGGKGSVHMEVAYLDSFGGNTFVFRTRAWEDWRMAWDADPDHDHVAAESNIDYAQAVRIAIIRMDAWE